MEETPLASHAIQLILLIIFNFLAVSYLVLLYKHRCLNKRYENLKVGFKKVLENIEVNDPETLEL